MKQSAAKTLGVTALGAAFAAAAAGTAAAAPSVLPAPASATQLDVVSSGVSTLPATVEQVSSQATSQVLPAGESSPVKKLVGGLPLGSLPVGAGLPGLG